MSLGVFSGYVSGGRHGFLNFSEIGSSFDQGIPVAHVVFQMFLHAHGGQLQGSVVVRFLFMSLMA